MHARRFVALHVIIVLAGLMAIGTGALAQANLPAGGTWTRQLRPRGEAWTYSFEVPALDTSTPVPNTTATDDADAALAAPRILRTSGDQLSAKLLKPNAVIDYSADNAYFIDVSLNAVTSVIAGQAVYPAVDVGLGGQPPLTPLLSARATIDGVVWCQGQLALQFLYSRVELFCPLAFYPTPGTHLMQWTLNYDNSQPETNFANNSATRTFAPVSGQLDVIAQRAYFMSGPNATGNIVTTPAVGQTVYLYLDLTVQGILSPVSFTDAVTIDGALFCAVGGSAPGGLYYDTCPKPWTVTPGWHTITWTVDSTQVLNEYTRSNDTASVRFGDTLPQTGWWWDQNLNGMGFFVEEGGISNNGMFLGAFTYDQSQRATWLVSTGQMLGNFYGNQWLKSTGGATLLQTTPQAATQTPVGPVSMLFSDPTHGRMTRSDGSTINITRLGFTGFSSIPLPARGAPQNGWWWGPYAGTGYGIEIQGTNIFVVAYVYSSAGDPVWYLAYGNMVTSTYFVGSWDLYSGGPQINAKEDPNWHGTDLGSATTMSLVFTDPSHGVLTMGPTQIPISRFQLF